mmetsp:Transcript_4747/g.9945  ORF Transcript_4747/g.9945 Transcript_4747/m.9945 type:complete len:314 (-) Transcript_4747:658-1599(-)
MCTHLRLLFALLICSLNMQVSGLTPCLLATFLRASFHSPLTPRYISSPFSVVFHISPLFFLPFVFMFLLLLAGYYCGCSWEWVGWGHAFLSFHLLLVQKNFPDFEIVGWYSIGSHSATDFERACYRQIEEHCEAPLLVTLATNQIGSQQRVLPLYLYEGEFVQQEQGRSLTFVEKQYTLKPEEAERIAVDQVAFLSSSEDSHAGESFSKQMKSFKSATEMLIEQIQVVLSYVVKTKSGAIKPDASVLRMIASLTDRLPSLDAPELVQPVKQETDQAVVMGTLSSLTQAADSITIASSKLTMGIDKLSRKGIYF